MLPSSSLCYKYVACYLGGIFTYGPSAVTLAQFSVLIHDWFELINLKDYFYRPLISPSPVFYIFVFPKQADLLFCTAGLWFKAELHKHHDLQLINLCIFRTPILYCKCGEWGCDKAWFIWTSCCVNWSHPYSCSPWFGPSVLSSSWWFVFGVISGFHSVPHRAVNWILTLAKVQRQNAFQFRIDVVCSQMHIHHPAIWMKRSWMTDYLTSLECTRIWWQTKHWKSEARIVSRFQLTAKHQLFFFVFVLSKNCWIGVYWGISKSNGYVFNKDILDLYKLLPINAPPQ